MANLKIVNGYKELIKSLLKNEDLTKEDLYSKLSNDLDGVVYLEGFEKAFEQLKYGDELTSETLQSTETGLIDILYGLKEE